MKIAFVSEIPTPYRVPVYRQLSQETNFQCRFFFCSQVQADRAWPVDDFHSLDKVVLRGWQFQRKGKNTLTTYINPEIMSLIRRGNFDLAVIGGWHQPTMVMAILACLSKGIPFVLHSESHARKPRAWWRRALRRFYPGCLIRRAAGYLVTGSLAADYVAAFGAKRENVFIFPNTVDTAASIKEARRLAKKKNYLHEELKLPGRYNLIFVGRLVQVKGIETLLQAFERVADKLPEWGLLIVGDGPLRHRLSSYQLRHQALKDRIVTLPYVDPKELIRYYVASDLFVLPSLDEPWGVVVNEAMACGLPVILSTHVGAAADLLKEGENGYSHPPEDVNALAEKILKLGSDDALRDKMGVRSLDIIADWGYEKNMHAFKALVQKKVKQDQDNHDDDDDTQH